ncbi:IMS domain-containing protein [Prochlorococcus sp. AH-716-K03]|nr:IMS domain-containing protein [Prochlorococcus sp. AH-716-K03]
MELPLDHFRLIGVSPSATSEEILRAFQLRLDKTPDDGFTYEVLTQRSELLRLTADLLSDPDSRREYENLLLDGVSGLDLSSNREVAGLILLWESGSPKEAFKITRKALQPPQTPALGSSRESDLTLLAALTSRDAAIQEQEQRSYSNAADFLQEGIQVLQRMGKLVELRKNLEEDLASLLPYRILDLLSRDLKEYESHKKGLSLLENLIIKRGGLEGNNKSEYNKFLNQQEFESFFQQIKPLLTLQEQIDLFLGLQKRGSGEAGFLAFLSLTANGFASRKPEKLFEARKILKKLNLSGLDSMPLIGCLDLLLADVEQCSARFLSSSDEKLRDWLNNYPGEKLEAICLFCKNWLENDVLVGYRDIDLKEIDLDSWFQDREIQEFIEQLERKQNRTILTSNFQNQPESNAKESLKDLSLDPEINEDNFEERRLPFPGGIKKDEKQVIKENIYTDEIIKNKSLELYNFAIEKIAELKFIFGEVLEKNQIFYKSPYLIYFYAFLILFSFGIGVELLRKNFKKPLQDLEIIDNSALINKDNKVPNEDSNLNDKKKDLEKSNITFSDKINETSFLGEELTTASPSLEQIKYLINSWLVNKSNFLAGRGQINLSKIVQNDLINRLTKERQLDIQKGIYKNINTNIENIVFLTQTASRISVSVDLKYTEKILKIDGELINETTFSPFLKVKYILGFSNNSWKLVDYISGA